MLLKSFILFLRLVVTICTLRVSSSCFGRRSSEWLEVSWSGRGLGNRMHLTSWELKACWGGESDRPSAFFSCISYESSTLLKWEYGEGECPYPRTSWGVGRAQLLFCRCFLEEEGIGKRNETLQYIRKEVWKCWLWICMSCATSERADDESGAGCSWGLFWAGALE